MRYLHKLIWYSLNVSFDALDTLFCTWAHWPISIWFSSYFLTLSDIFILVVVTCTHCSLYYSTYIFNMSAYNTYINCLFFILLQIWSQNRTRGFCKGVFLYTPHLIVNVIFQTWFVPSETACARHKFRAGFVYILIYEGVWRNSIQKYVLPFL